MMYFKHNWPWIIGWVLTLCVLYFAYVSASWPACYETAQGVITCTTKWFYFKQSTPNELGDTLAGFAGALAFIWIIVTVAMQSVGLSEQRKATLDVASAMNHQATKAKFEYESIKLDHYLRELSDQILDVPKNAIWFVPNFANFKVSKGYFTPFKHTKTHEIDVFIKNSSRDIQYFYGLMSVLAFDHHAYAAIAVKSSFVSLKEQVKKIITFSDSSEEMLKLRCESIGLSQILDAIDGLLELDIWSPTEEFPPQ